MQCDTPTGNVTQIGPGTASGKLAFCLPSESMTQGGSTHYGQCVHAWIPAHTACEARYCTHELQHLLQYSTRLCLWSCSWHQHNSRQAYGLELACTHSHANMRKQMHDGVRRSTNPHDITSIQDGFDFETQKSAQRMHHQRAAALGRPQLGGGQWLGVHTCRCGSTCVLL